MPTAEPKLDANKIEPNSFRIKAIVYQIELEI